LTPRDGDVRESPEKHPRSFGANLRSSGSFSAYRPWQPVNVFGFKPDGLDWNVPNCFSN